MAEYRLLLKQKKQLEEVIQEAEKKIRHDYPDAHHIVEQIRELREHVQATVAETYRCRIEKALIGVMGFGERMRVLWDDMQQVISQPHEYVKPEEWSWAFIELITGLLEEECDCQRHPC